MRPVERLLRLQWVATRRMGWVGSSPWVEPIRNLKIWMNPIKARKSTFIRNLKLVDIIAIVRVAHYAQTNHVLKIEYYVYYGRISTFLLLRLIFLSIDLSSSLCLLMICLFHHSFVYNTKYIFVYILYCFVYDVDHSYWLLREGEILRIHSRIIDRHGPHSNLPCSKRKN